MAMTADATGTEVAAARITFDRDPATYRHWRLAIDGPVATVTMAVDPDATLGEGYELKLNSYDLGVDIELHDLVQRLRFEHPEVRAVVLTGALDKVFCAGANIRMLATATHHHKVNFCKFTNETRNGIEDATANSGQVWIAAVNGTAAGGGYELAVACDEIVLVDDRSSSVSLPEVPLLAVLPGTGGLTRVVDKRHVRRDLADVFATKTEGIKGAQAVEWGLVDALAAPSDLVGAAQERARARAAGSDRPTDGVGVALTPLRRHRDGDVTTYDEGVVEVRIDRELSTAHVTVRCTGQPVPADASAAVAAGVAFWPLAVARALDDALLDLRFNEPSVASIAVHTAGEAETVMALDAFMAANADDWFVREVRLFLARTFKRLDLTAKTIVALIEPGSCYAGTLAELALAADRSLMLEGSFWDDDRPAAEIRLSDANLGAYPMSNGLSRLASRFWGRPEALDAAVAELGRPLVAEDALSLELVTFTPDDIDWDEEVRLTLEERASFSPDALTGMEANLRFVGPETPETKVFGRLTAWQNWIFQRPNAAGPEGALRRYGSGSRPDYDHTRI